MYLKLNKKWINMEPIDKYKDVKVMYKVVYNGKKSILVNKAL